MTRKKLFLTATVPLFFIFYSSAFAHVIVTPSQTGIASYQTFTVSVPGEKNIPVTSLRLVVPEGVENVIPTVKPGWRITMKRVASTPTSPVVEITWTQGVIPVGLRDEFSFKAKTPATPSIVVWRAYQTYQDGSVVSWDMDPQSVHGEDEGDSGPYSTTEVIDDLAKAGDTSPFSSLSFLISITALVLSSFSLLYKRNK